MPALDAFAIQALEKLAKNQRIRTLWPLESAGGAWVKDVNGGRYLSFASNDYLGLSQHPMVVGAAKAALGHSAGAGASRLAGGNHPLYSVLESQLAQWKQTEAARVFGSGYLANLGVISALMGAGDVIFADKLSHACMLDGAKLSGATLHRFLHNDMASLKAQLEAHRTQGKHALIMTEAIFSMDGDAAPLTEIATLAEAYDAWLLVDVAHALTALPTLPKDRTIMVGTLSKSLGAYGGFVVGSQTVIDYLSSSARSLLFSTALPPAVLAAASAALGVWMVDAAPAKKAMQHAQNFAAAFDLPAPDAAIVPLVIGEENTALQAMEMLKAQGFYVPAIRPPTVPVGTSRLRFSLSALHEDADVERLIQAVKELFA